MARGAQIWEYRYEGGPLDGTTVVASSSASLYRGPDGGPLLLATGLDRMGSRYKPGPEDVYVRVGEARVYRWAKDVMDADRARALIRLQARLARELAARRPSLAYATRLEIELVRHAQRLASSLPLVPLPCLDRKAA